MTIRELNHPVFGVSRQIIAAEDFLPATPAGWVKIDSALDGGAYKHVTHNGQMLTVIMSAGIEDDGIAWVHLSVGKRTSTGKRFRQLLPTWDELKFAKRSFAGPDVDCIQVIPRESEHINLNEVLHVFYRLDGKRTCPDFTSGTHSI